MADVFVGTAELLQLGDGNVSDIDVTELLEDTPLVAIMSAIEASHEDVHKWRKKTAAPAAGYRSLYDGRENTVATYTDVTQSLKLYDAGFTIDKAVMGLRSGEALMRREAIDHLRAAFVDFEKQIIYGTGQDAAGFNGFANETSVDAVADDMVVDAGGATADGTTSVWAVRMGESAVSAVYGAGGEIMIGESYDTLKSGSSTGVYDAVRTPLMFWGGVQVATSLDLARIVNLDDTATLTDDMLSDLISLFPAGRGPSYLVMNRQSRKQLQQSRTATTVTGAPAPFPTEAFNVPIIVTDQITNGEAVVA